VSYTDWRTAARVMTYIDIILDSSTAEQSAVNRQVVGSNPTRGATKVGRGYPVWGKLRKRVVH
jgi:hypothetical protein